MVYKKRLIILLSIISVLIIIYTAGFIFDPERTGSRTDSYIWLDSNSAVRASRIIIDDGYVKKEIIKRNNQWFIIYNGMEFPARKTRIDDFISTLTTRSIYPVRSTNAQSHGRFGLGEDAARITVYAENTVLLDLLLGNEDSTGHEIYFRKYGQNEVRSGEDKFNFYITSAHNVWYNLRLIPETEDGLINADSVQRFSVYTPEESRVFSRWNREWSITGIDIVNPDVSVIETYLFLILNAEGDNFIDNISGSDPILNHSSIVLEFGDGSIKTIRLSEEDEDGRRLAHISGAGYVYSLPNWMVQRLFRNASDFERR